MHCFNPISTKDNTLFDFIDWNNVHDQLSIDS
jgi:hypothetical protein